MPIAQSRVIALINAALDSFKAAKAIHTNPNPSLSTFESFFSHYSETRHTIEQELMWFNTHAARNARATQSMRDLRERRRADGTLPPPQNRRKHIPKSLYETEQINDPGALSEGQSYQVQRGKSPLLSKEERDRESTFRKTYEGLKARGMRDTEPCMRCGSTVEWCAFEDRNLICPGNRIRNWEPEYELLAPTLTPVQASSPFYSKPKEWDLDEREYDPKEMPPEGRNS